MWKYDQSNGRLYKHGTLISTGYSGKGRGKNNPTLQGVQGVGPIPRGKYRIGKAYDSKNVGPIAIPLYAIDATPNNDIHDETNRSAFRMHGDSVSAPGTASRGCIIMPRPIRVAVSRDEGEILEVVE